MIYYTMVRFSVELGLGGEKAYSAVADYYRKIRNINRAQKKQITTHLRVTRVLT